jgi:hypothetical protein
MKKSVESPSFQPAHRSYLAMVGSAITPAISSVVGLIVLKNLLEQQPDLVENQYKELKLLQLLMLAKKNLALEDEASFDNLIGIFQKLREVLPDDVFARSIEAMKQNPKRRDPVTGLKVRISSVQIVDYLMKELAESTSYLSHPMKNLKTCFQPEPPFRPVSDL